MIKDKTLSIREFESGANRNSSLGKLAYKDFINPLNEYSFATYMDSKRLLDDGTYRNGDNWQHGIPQVSLADSLIRHVKEFELLHLGLVVIHVINKSGEKTFVLNNTDELDEINKKFDTVNIKVISMEDVLNAIRFNSEAYKLQLLGYYK